MRQLRCRNWEGKAGTREDKTEGAKVCVWEVCCSRKGRKEDELRREWIRNETNVA